MTDKLPAVLFLHLLLLRPAAPSFPTTTERKKEGDIDTASAREHQRGKRRKEKTKEKQKWCTLGMD